MFVYIVYKKGHVALNNMLSLFIAGVYAACTPDLVVDDFTKEYSGALPGETQIRKLNMLGADYGVVGGTFNVDTNAKQAIIIPNVQSPADNYWFAKYNWQACFDLSKYSAFQFELTSPAGSDVQFTLTQHASDCTTRLNDSVYLPLTKYIKPNGTKQLVTLPFSDFAKNVAGGDYDFVHLKDWTAVNFVPADGKTEFRFGNLVLKGKCDDAPKPSASNSPSAPGASSTGKANNAQAVNAGAIMGAALAVLAL